MTIAEIKNAVQELSRDEQKELFEWLDQLREKQWDQEIENDLEAVCKLFLTITDPPKSPLLRGTFSWVNEILVGNVETMGRWGVGELGSWGVGKLVKLRNNKYPITLSPYHLIF